MKLRYYLPIAVLLCASTLSAQAIGPSLYQDLRYRVIGPFRASRTVGAVGVPSQPSVFYVGVNNGGVWKTDDYGRTWNPIFDDAPTGSVGDIAVSPSHPEIIYVGTGEGLHRPDLSVGDGIFKSTNGGEAWDHVGLGDVQQVGRLIIHPTNPDIVFVAGMGHPYGANEERGVFRTKDGGATWEKVLYIDHNTGAATVEMDPSDPDTLYAALWEHRVAPWENGRFSGPNSGLHKSTDGGTTWRPISQGLPAAMDLGRIGVGISASNPKRLYATVGVRQSRGIYRSDDAGESWKLVSSDRRLAGDIRVHPRNPERVFIGNIASYRSDDGGTTWTSIKGAPGGDDYQRIWINPEQPDIMLFSADQGATITVNGGRTWSSWYNQPTAQLYHVTTDNQFPYWVYGGSKKAVPWVLQVGVMADKSRSGTGWALERMSMRILLPIQRIRTLSMAGGSFVSTKPRDRRKTLLPRRFAPGSIASSARCRFYSIHRIRRCCSSPPMSSGRRRVGARAGRSSALTYRASKPMSPNVSVISPLTI